jgi:hypothetical protein
LGALSDATRTGGAGSPDARVLRYLRSHWSRLFRLTTVAQAMAALDLPPEPEQRRRIGDYLLAHPETHPTLGRWGARTFILTDDEKRLGLYLALQPRGVAGPRSAARAAAALGCTPDEVQRGLSTLERVGLVAARAAGGRRAYRLVPGWRHLAGPLEFTYHAVTLEGGEQFNVP